VLQVNTNSQVDISAVIEDIKRLTESA